MLKTSKTSPRSISMILVTFSLSMVVFYFATVYLALATFSYLSICLGIKAARMGDRLAHLRLMVFGVILDLALVITLELQRSAIKTASQLSLSLPQQLHIGFSLLAVLFYFPLIYMGWRIYKNATANAKLSTRHRLIGYLAFAFRTLGFILMFSLLDHVTKSA